MSGRNASGQFEIYTELMKMKHYLLSLAEAVTNEGAMPLSLALRILSHGKRSGKSQERSEVR